MSITMQNLSLEYWSQYCALPLSEAQSTCHFQMEIENVPIQISVFMEREKIPDPFLASNKAFRDRANIQIDLPQDKQVRKIVRQHFESQFEFYPLKFRLEEKIFASFSIAYVKTIGDARWSKYTRIFPKDIADLQLDDTL